MTVGLFTQPLVEVFQHRRTTRKERDVSSVDENVAGRQVNVAMKFVSVAETGDNQVNLLQM
jgi:hypothetical protein